MFCRFEMLALDLLTLHKDGIYFSKIYTYIFSTVSLNDTCDNLPLFFKILNIEYLSFFFPYLLNNNLLCFLCCNSSEIFRCDLNFNGITYLSLVMD